MSHRGRTVHHGAKTSYATDGSPGGYSGRRHHYDHEPPQRSGRDYAIVHAGRQWRLGPLAFWSTVFVVGTMAVWSAGTATYFAFRDDLLTRLIARQAEMQYAYEDRIAELRAQVDRLTSRQLLDQEQVEQRIENLARRQAVLESRTATLSELPEANVTGSVPPAQGGRLGLRRGGRASQINDTVIVAPPPDRHSSLESRIVSSRLIVGSAGNAANGRQAGIAARLASIEQSLDRVEARHNATLLAVEDRYEAKARRIKSVLSDLGIDPGRIGPVGKPSGVGGPYIPALAKLDASSFERHLHRVAIARAHVERLSRSLVNIPVRKPLAEQGGTSSGFGVRLDPFMRAPAIHSGLDFRAPVGEAVRATAAGTVETAGWHGGYGRMVEIDHGNGFSTRYAHLSEILVKEGQSVRPGQIIGRVGSTGRSTGPHLHYETRINGDPVDPQKFLRAGLRLGERM